MRKSHHIVLLFVFIVLCFFCSSDQAKSSASPDSQADLVLINGKVITVDARDSIAQAVAVKEDKIVKVGTTAQINPLIGPGTKVIDLRGKTVTPGIIDSHIHVLYYGRQFWDGYLDIRFPKVKDRDDLLQAVAQKAKTLPKGAWISGNQGFHVQKEDTLNRWVLDSIAPDNPVYLRHGSGQYAVVNSLALKMAGIDKNTSNPYGGKIVKDPSTGEPTGVLLHYPAENLVGKIASGYGDRTEKDLEADLKKGQEMCLAAGITSGQDVILANPRDIKIYKNLADKNELRMRMYLQLYVNSEEQAKKYAEMIKGFKTDMLTFAGWKLAVDGGNAAGTALMYNNNLMAARNAYYFYDPETLKRIVLLLHNTGLQISFHIVGDKGIDEALDAIEYAVKQNTRKDPRHRIEHAIWVDPKSLDRISKLGVVISTQPQWISWHADGLRMSTDEASMANCMPLRSFLHKGIPLAFGCDVPAALAHEPKWAFFGATTRRTKSGYVPSPNEKLTIREALRVHTMGSAYAAFEENIKGSIEQGKLADLVIWSHDLYSIKPQDLKDFKAEVTIVGGKIVYDAKTRNDHGM
jgi:predicted amidohydrolase YtcJ